MPVIYDKEGNEVGRSPQEPDPASETDQTDRHWTNPDTSQMEETYNPPSSVKPLEIKPAPQKSGGNHLLRDAAESLLSAVAPGLGGAVKLASMLKDSTTSQTPSELKPKDVSPGTAQAQSVTSGPAPSQSIPQPQVKAKSNGHAASSPALKEPSYETFTPSEIKNADPNAGEDTLGKNKDEASKRLADATQVLKDSQTVSPGQKLAMALIGLLPALGGGLIGAAIHNPTSAAAGISGGLEGSAKGLESLNQDQKAKIAQAQKGVDTEKGNLLAAGKDLLERQMHNKDFARGVGEKNTEEQNKAGEEGSKDRNATKMHTYLEQLTNAKDIQVGRERNAMELAKEHGAKSERADANARIETTAADNIQAGRAAIARLKNEITKQGNTQWFNGDVKHNAILSQDLPAVALALHQAQQMNARSVPGPEVDKLQESRLPAGLFTRNDRTLAALSNIEQEINDKAGAIAGNSKNPLPSLTQGAPGQAAPDLTKHMGF